MTAVPEKGGAGFWTRTLGVYEEPISTIYQNVSFFSDG